MSRKASKQAIEKRLSIAQLSSDVLLSSTDLSKVRQSIALSKSRMSKSEVEVIKTRIEILSTPRKDFYKPPKIIRTRWSKPGPWKSYDWEQFKEWAEEKAAPKEIKMLPEPEHIWILIDELIPSINRLSKPRYRREKFRKMRPPEFNFRPKINDPSSEKEKPRVLPPEYKKCQCCVACEEEKEAIGEFPKFPAALKYNATDNIKKLSKPRIRPEQILSPIKTKKMSYKRWKMHLFRLLLLSKPKLPRPPRIEKVPIRIKVPLRKLQPTLKRLAKPKIYKNIKDRKIGVVKKSALKAEASERVSNLAKAQERKSRKKYTKPKKSERTVKKSALNYEASERLKTLAQAKTVKEEPIKVERKKRKYEKRYNEDDIMGYL